MQSDQGFSMIDELELGHQQECVKPRYELWKQTTSLLYSIVGLLENLSLTYLCSLHWSTTHLEDKYIVLLKANTHIYLFSIHKIIHKFNYTFYKNHSNELQHFNQFPCGTSFHRHTNENMT